MSSDAVTLKTGEAKPQEEITDPKILAYANDMNGVLVRAMPMNQDERGTLTELFREDVIAREARMMSQKINTPPMAYFSYTKQDVVRGPHFHFNQTDIFVFLSDWDVWLWDAREDSGTFEHKTKIRIRRQVDQHPGAFAAPSRVIVPPGVVHAFTPRDGVGLYVNCPDQLFKGWDRKNPADEVRHEDDPNSPYVTW